MAYYSTTCEKCTDASKRCSETHCGKGEEAQTLQMYECDNEACKLNIARVKGIKQLQTLKAEAELARERSAARPAPARRGRGGLVYSSSRDHRRHS